MQRVRSKDGQRGTTSEKCIVVDRRINLIYIQKECSIIASFYCG